MKMNPELLQQWLNWCRSESHAAILLSNNYPDPNGNYEAMFGIGAKQVFEDPNQLEDFEGLAFGHISYQYKKNWPFVDQTFQKESDVPDFAFFEPQYSFLLHRDGVVHEQGIRPSENTSPELGAQEFIPPFIASTNKTQYLQKIEEIREHIRQGVFYEMNYCIDFHVDAFIDPYELFYHLNSLAPSPFAAFYKLGNQFLLCASPERFLLKNEQTLVSQPIKGTRKRIIGKEAETIEELRTHEKDRAENTMIVDLVRNDLSQVCKVGTVKVPEWCEIYTFSHVHQMISTVVGEIKSGVTFNDILKATFPMGSMTGAPKIEVMKHIDRLENFSRGWYSGSIGYMNHGQFDLNVIIRSLEYHQGKLSYRVGGAITFDSIPEEEYEECMTKAAAMVALIEKMNQLS